MVTFFVGPSGFSAHLSLSVDVGRLWWFELSIVLVQCLARGRGSDNLEEVMSL